MKPLLARDSDVADLLGVSKRQVWEFARRGDLTPIRPEGMRIVRFRVAEVEALVQRWSNQASAEVEAATDSICLEKQRAGSRGKRDGRLLSTTAGRREQSNHNAETEATASTTN